jgi:hypothetical protein
MRKRGSPDNQLDRMHWEELVRTMIELIGVEQLDEVIGYVIEQMQAERRKLHHFAVECRRVEH